MNTLANAYLSPNNPKKAIEYLEKALEIDGEIGDRRSQTIDLNLLGKVLERSGQPHEATECYERSLQISRELNDTKSMSYNLYALGQIHFRLQEYDQAEKYYKECSELPSGTKPVVLMNIFEKLGIIYESWEENTEALEFYKKAHKFSRGKKREKLEKKIQNLE